MDRDAMSILEYRGVYDHILLDGAWVGCQSTRHTVNSSRVTK